MHPTDTRATDVEAMLRAVQIADASRYSVSPRPWVGAVIEPGGFTGGTQGTGGPHAEVLALAAAGEAAQGATLYTTLEPCCHTGRTGPCTEAIINAGVRRVVVACTDPDTQVAGAGVARLRAAGIEVDIGVGAEAAAAQLAPYLHHRRTGRPLVVLKMAITLDGRTAAPDGTSQWITGPEARLDAHQLRAESDAILVGSGTVHADDPALTVRLDGYAGRQPRRLVLGRAPAEAAASPLEEVEGPLDDLLDRLGSEGVLQLLVEGGADVAAQFHRNQLVDRYVLYLAPAIMGGDDGRPCFSGAGTSSIGEMWRGRVLSVRQIGPDVRLDMVRNDPEDPS